MNLNQIIEGVVLSKVCSIKPDKDSTDVKQVTLKVKFDGTTLQSVFDKAVAGTVISWQNGPGRKGFDNWKVNQAIDVDFKSPARTQIDPIDAITAAAKASGMSIEDYIKAEIAKRK